jgi:uncharacterized membrane protein
MTIRSPRERTIQAICYELGGLLLAGPLYAVYAGQGAAAGFGVILTLAVACMLWSPLHNTVFDLIDWRLSGRLASDRPHRWRLVHALTHEATSAAVTVPILVVLGGHGWAEALLVDLTLTAAYAGYAYVFHLIYDRWRPVVPAAAPPAHAPPAPAPPGPRPATPAPKPATRGRSIKHRGLGARAGGR